ncbi:hypothetical protein LTR84_005105 [Exophiala bonariae]|uniref:1-alkyl-2-acetylglycerophosphocholine esterase n=1 Tax=Exophiala bonariae TaxID=1690606 RepID=A0AAV9NRH9_9EURO|nr:hypothetical protein LTR84_005105 [Exophiala bonariae]
MGLLSALLAVVLLGDVARTASVTIPQPSGQYGVALKTVELVNTGMLDPYAPSKQNRRIVLSAFYPTSMRRGCQHIQTPYMPPATAEVYDQLYSSIGLPNGTFGALELTLCSPRTTPQRRNRVQHPIVVFSPGLSNSRLIYSSVAANLAAQGFVVLTVDHPYDGAIVEFPDGSFVLATDIDTDEQIEAALAVRTKDIKFVNQQLQNRTLTQDLFKGIYGSVDLRQRFAHGHSLGGATAAATMLEDNKFLGGINLDGTFFGDVVAKGLDRPFMIFAHEGKNLTTDQSWADLWSHLRSSKFEASVKGTAHGSYTDFPMLLDVLGLRALLPADLAGELVGTISGSRMLEILSTSTASFFRFVGCQISSGQLKRTLSQFPEVAVLNATVV